MTARRLALAAEAFATLLVVSLVLRFMPFAAVARSARRPARRLHRHDADAQVRLVAWAIDAAARRARFRAVCIERALAGQLMLRRRGIATVLHYGAAPDPERGLIAHVWLSWRDRLVIGGQSAARFAQLATFPDDEDCASGA